MKVILKTIVLGTVASCLMMMTAPAPAQTAGESPELEHVLSQMDATAKKFGTAQANVVWDQYDSVIKETDTQTGKIYFRREDGEIQMATDFTTPDPKYVIYSGGKVQVYLPKINEVDEYDATKHRSDVESFLVLGFGGSGKDLFNAYAVKSLGTETVSGISAEKLELIPKSVHLRNNIGRILLWIDPKLGISVQQQFFESSGNYRLAKYSDIQLNQKLPDGAFKLKTNAKTKVVSPQG